MASAEVISMAAADSFHDMDEGGPNDVKTIIQEIVKKSLSKNVIVNNEDPAITKIDTEVLKSPTRSIQQQKNSSPIKAVAKSPRYTPKKSPSSSATSTTAQTAARQARTGQRSQSLPTAGSPEIPSGNNKEPSLYKTELCKPFLDSGFCRYGGKCQFAHGYHELKAVLRHRKYKTEPCKNFQRNGKCPYGSRCRFVHAESDDQLTKINCLNASGPCAVHAPDDRGVAVVEPAQRAVSTGHVRRWTDQPVAFRSQSASQSGDEIVFGREVQFKDYTKGPGDRSRSLQFREYPSTIQPGEHCGDPAHNDGLPYCAECRQTARRSHDFDHIPLPPPAAPGQYTRRSYDSGSSVYAPPREYAMEQNNDYRVRSKSFSNNQQQRQFSPPMHRRFHSSGEFRLEPVQQRPQRQSMPATLQEMSGDEYLPDGPACNCADCAARKVRMYKPRQKGHPKIDPLAYAGDAPGFPRREGEPRRPNSRVSRSPGKDARNKARSTEMNLNNTPGESEPLVALPEQRSPGGRPNRSPQKSNAGKPRRVSVEPVGGDEGDQ